LLVPVLGGCPRPRGGLVSSLGGWSRKWKTARGCSPTTSLVLQSYGRPSWRSSKPKAQGERSIGSVANGSGGRLEGVFDESRRVRLSQNPPSALQAASSHWWLDSRSILGPATCAGSAETLSQYFRAARSRPRPRKTAGERRRGRRAQTLSQTQKRTRIPLIICFSRNGRQCRRALDASRSAGFVRRPRLRQGRRRARPHEAVPQARPEIPPGPQPGRGPRGSRREVPSGVGRLRRFE
jgi:hypothetical protein